MRAKCQAEYNGDAIQKLKAGKDVCWDYIKSIPARFQPECISAIKLVLKKR